MGLWSWLKDLLFPPTQRDISRLEVPANAVDAVLETVDLSGKPLKEHHLRRALRDPRLLPKKKAFVRLWKRPPWIGFAESKRLFAATMRTRNRNIRDLLPDEEQLRRRGLPVWKTEQDLADALGIGLSTLRFFSIHRERETACHYVTFSIPKRNGERRLIMAPKHRLKEILRQLLVSLVDRLPVSDAAHGFRRGRSVATHAREHVGKAIVVTFDIRNFFPTLHFGRVRGYLIAMGYGFAVATALAVLMTEAERQPVRIGDKVYHVPVSPRHCVQGAPTSPGLANAIFLRADRRLARLALSLGLTYSRYADDLTFSGDDPGRLPALFHLVPAILREEGFVLNPAKTRVMRAAGRQRVTGVTVNRTAGLSRRERRLIRAQIHRVRAGSEAGRQELATIRGRIAWVNSLNPGQAAILRHRLDGLPGSPPDNAPRAPKNEAPA